jgi:hypothetical protein
MSWVKHFRVVKPGSQSPLTNSEASEGSVASGTSSKFSSYLPEVYAGHPNRIQRYYQYADMDRDSDINAALDTIADFCTQSEEQNDDPFEVFYNDEANETEVTLLKTYMKMWVGRNDFKSRLWYMFRGTIMNGDQFFLRDPETGEWLWIDHFAVEMVKVDETQGKEPDEYIVRGLDLNKQGKFATRSADPSQYRTPFGTSLVPGSRPQNNPGGGGQANQTFQMAGANRDPRSQAGGQSVNELSVVDAEHVIHLSLSVGMDINWPFGQSVLEPIYKVYKQKELLEDSIIIYRVQRAPERRIFYIDVGNIPPIKAKAHVEQIKNEIHQRRIPNRTGGGTSIMDAAYNPLSIIEDYFFAQTPEGRGSKVETLPGGDNLGEIGDLTFFTKKMARGLRIPSSYLALGDDDGSGGMSYNDGKLGAAVIQEYRFNKYCMRLQSLLSPIFDKDFKRFLKLNGIEIEDDLFELRFNPPQNFTKYRQIEIDMQQMQVYQGIQDNKKIAERMKFKRYLNWSDDEIIENERMWAEENSAKLKKKTGTTPADAEPEGDLSSVGLRMGAEGADMGDLGAEDIDIGDQGPGGEAPPGGGATGGASNAGAATPPPGAGGQPPL